MIENPIVNNIPINFQGNALAISVFLVESDEGPILIETGPHSTVLDVEAGLALYGYKSSDIKHVFLTHIHLDHGGAAWYFAQQGSMIYLHPIGLPHYNNPEKLIASAQMIYQDRMHELWGDIKPIDIEHLTIVQDNEIVQIAEHQFQAIYTPGHAKHHIAWKLKNNLFTGDVTGIRINLGPVIPPVPPPDIHIETWKKSIEKVLKLEDVTTYYLTHGGAVTDLKDHMMELKNTLDDYANFILPFVKNGKTAQEVLQPFIEFVKQDLITKGVTNPKERETIELANPSFMGVAGLMRYWKKTLSKS